VITYTYSARILIGIFARITFQLMVKCKYFDPKIKFYLIKRQSTFKLSNSEVSLKQWTGFKIAVISELAVGDDTTNFPNCSTSCKAPNMKEGNKNLEYGSVLKFSELWFRQFKKKKNQDAKF